MITQNLWLMYSKSTDLVTINANFNGKEKQVEGQNYSWIN